MLHIITRLILSIVNVPMDLLALIGQVDYLKSMHDTYLKRCMNIFGIYSTDRLPAYENQHT